MTQKLTSQNATIQTAQVEVKTLTISGKQVTLAVFRQIPDATLIEPISLGLMGHPWGIVNYHPDRCNLPDSPEHIHVLWQKDGGLYRTIVYNSVIADTYYYSYMRGQVSDQDKDDYREKYAALVWKLRHLDQLYIAV